MPTNKDHYDILGVPRQASTGDIKKAYWKLAHKHHPDKGGTREDEEKFREVQEAYEVLSDDQKRAAYDQFGHAGAANAGAGPGFSGFQGSAEGFDFNSFGDIFEQFFTGFGGAGTRQRGPSRGSDLQVSVTVEFEEAVRGGQKEVSLTRRATCGTCDGDGAAKGAKIVTCQRCGGRGEVQVTRRTVLGTMAQVAQCPECHGQGKRPEKACPTCGGEGRVQKKETLSVKIPPGIDDGQTIRVQGAGEAGERGAPSGHAYVIIRVKPSKVFERDGADLRLVVPVSFPQAALGDSIEVPTPTGGTTTLKIPAGTQSGASFKLRGEGMPKLGSAARGDLTVTVQVVVPKKLSAEERKLVEELARRTGKAHGGKSGLFGRLGL